MPLSDAEALEYISRRTAKGIPRDQIMREVELEGLADPLSIPAFLQPPPPDPGRKTRMDSVFGSEPVPTGESMRALAVIGAGAAAAPLTAGMSFLPAIATEAVATGLTDLSVQGLHRTLGGPPVEPKESLGVTGATAAGGALGRGIAHAAGEFIGIARDLIRRAGGRVPGAGFGLTLKAPSRTAELDLGRKVQESLSTIQRTITGGRKAKQSILWEAQLAGVRVPAQGVANTLLAQKVPAASAPWARQFNATLDDFATRLAARGDMTPQEFDQFIIRELDDKIFGAAGEPSQTMIGKALSDVRDVAVDTLTTTLERAGHAGIREANARASGELLFRENAEQVFGPGKLSLEVRLRNLFKPGHEAEQELLKEIGDRAGVDLLDEARKLATRRAFTVDPRAGADRATGMFRQVLEAIFFAPIARVSAPLQPIIGPALGGRQAFREGEKDRRRREAQEALEEQMRGPF